MLSFLGWVLVIGALVLIVSAFRKPEKGTASAFNRAHLLAGIGALIAGVLLALSSSLALANLQPVDLSHPDDWATNPAATAGAAVHWDGKALVADLESGSGRYAVFPVDWEADAFEAAWDVTFTRLDRAQDLVVLKDGLQTRTQPRGQLDYASVGVGLMDQSVADIDDRDHVSGSALEATFSDDIRLRASDANYIVRTSSATESGKLDLDPDFRKTAPMRIELNKKYRCDLTYRRPSHLAELTVRDESGKLVVKRRIEELKDFTNSVAWFGVSVRGYNRFNKKLDAKKDASGYTRSRATLRIENVLYRQP